MAEIKPTEEHLSESITDASDQSTKITPSSSPITKQSFASWFQSTAKYHTPTQEPILLTSSTASRDSAVEVETSKSRFKKPGYFDIPPSSPNPMFAQFNNKDRIYTASPTDFDEERRSFSTTGPKSPDLRLDLASPIIPSPLKDPGNKPMTEIRAGQIAKPFHVRTDLLLQKSPYFAAMQSTPDNPQPIHRLEGPFFFLDINEFAFAIFVRWLYGGTLRGPHDFHSMSHYLGLYVLARRFQIETLLNHVMDAVREYYHSEDKTAPAFRLEYIFSNTDEPNPMRDFLVSTAAYRALTDPSSRGIISESIRLLLQKGGDVSSDYAQALCTLVRNECADPRKGDPCRFHAHESTFKCKKWKGFEPWEDA